MVCLAVDAVRAVSRPGPVRSGSAGQFPVYVVDVNVGIDDGGQFVDAGHECIVRHPRVPVPVIASGGGGTPQHLVDVLKEGKADAALIASMVHSGAYTIGSIKSELNEKGVPVRF